MIECNYCNNKAIFKVGKYFNACSICIEDISTLIGRKQDIRDSKACNFCNGPMEYELYYGKDGKSNLICCACLKKEIRTEKEKIAENLFYNSKLYPGEVGE